MSIARQILAVTALAVVATTAACGSNGNAAQTTTLKVGASPTPHGDILRYIQDHEAKAAGINLQIVEFNDYVQPNKALQDKSIDANFFQHVPYLDAQIQQFGYKFTPLTPVIVAPIAVYSHKVKSLGELATGATIAVPNDPSNEARSLQLLQQKGVLKLKDGVQQPTARDIADNPKQIKIKELEAAQTPRVLDEVDAAVINDNYAIPAHLDSQKDSIAIESPDHNPYANVLVVRTEDKDKPAVKKLDELLCAQQTQDYIKQQFAGKVLVACPNKA